MLEDDNSNNRISLLTNHQVFPESIEMIFFVEAFFFKYIHYLDAITQDIENKKGSC